MRDTDQGTGTVKVLNKPVHSTIQDGGRHGFHHLGLTTGGPLDAYSHLAANALVGNLQPDISNAQDCQSIESTLGQIHIGFSVATSVAVTGARAPVWLNDSPVEQWQSIEVKPGDNLRIGATQQGLRTYVAFAGTLEVPKTLGSCATVAREGIGGLQGKALSQRDSLTLKARFCRPYSWPSGAIPTTPSILTLRFVYGYQWHRFSEAFRRKFQLVNYTTSVKSDRMGCVLSGPVVAEEDVRILSEGIALGAIQFPPDGQPIILLQDRQTIGGYPKLGSVVSSDLNRLVQAAPGTQVNFSAITAARAREHLLAYREKMTRAIALMD